jgi:hypothetical protein
MQDRRFGRFALSLDLLDQQPEIARLILRDVLILEAKSIPLNDIEYVGVHPAFEFVPVGGDIPTYIADVIEGAVRWSYYAVRPERSSLRELVEPTPTKEPSPEGIERPLRAIYKSGPLPEPDYDTPTATDVEDARWRREMQLLYPKPGDPPPTEVELKQMMARYQAGEISRSDMESLMDRYDEAREAADGPKLQREQQGQDHPQRSEAERYGLRGGPFEACDREESNLGPQPIRSEPFGNAAIRKQMKKSTREH